VQSASDKHVTMREMVNMARKQYRGFTVLLLSRTVQHFADFYDVRGTAVLPGGNNKHPQIIKITGPKKSQSCHTIRWFLDPGTAR